MSVSAVRGKKRAAEDDLDFRATKRAHIEGEAEEIQKMYALARNFGLNHSNIQEIARQDLPLDEKLAEMAAYIYLAKQQLYVEGEITPFNQLIAKTENDIIRRQCEHAEALGEYTLAVSDGIEHYILKLFASLLIPHNELEQSGICCIERLLGPTMISQELSETHFDHIKKVVARLEESQAFFEKQFDISQSMLFMLSLDLKIQLSFRLTQNSIKQAMILMLLSDIGQRPNEPICYAISLLIYEMYNYFGIMLDRLEKLLQTGCIEIEGIPIDVSALVQLLVVRPDEMQLYIPGGTDKLPIVKDTEEALGMRIQNALRLSDATQYNGRYAQAFICSYNRNLLQEMMIRSLVVCSMNGSLKELTSDKKFVIDQCVKRVVLPCCNARFRKRLSNALKKRVWLCDMNPFELSGAPGMVWVDGQMFLVQGDTTKLFEQIRNRSLIFWRNDYGGIEVVYTFRDLVMRVKYLAGALRVWTKSDVTQVAAELAEGFVKERFEEKIEASDLLGFCFLPQSGALLHRAMDQFKIPYRWVSKDAVPIKSYVSAVKCAAAALDPQKCLLLIANDHACTSSGGSPPLPASRLSKRFLDREVPHELVKEVLTTGVQTAVGSRLVMHTSRKASSLKELFCSDSHLPPKSRASLRSRIVEKSEKLTVDDLELEAVFKKLDPEIDDTLYLSILRSLPSAEPAIPVIWARSIRKALIEFRIGVYSSVRIEEVVREVHNLLPVFYFADSNWVGVSGHVHTKWRMQSTLVAEREKPEVFAVAENGKVYRESNFPEERVENGGYYMPV
ncbi:MAG: hypothetical protein S4CHLAM81_08210 [Chlamydiales bacterium]|nr:hypothetical protein [Chlamydiales bacterium]MCH9635603.1 hypothetical protein [Chlamydiales bacterium]MCH9703908.1 hypothetical protein [Chlamydiota bacterium]